MGLKLSIKLLSPISITACLYFSSLASLKIHQTLSIFICQLIVVQKDGMDF